MTVATAPAQSPPISPKLIISFVTAVRDVFSTMVGAEVRIGEPHLKSQPAPTYDVSSIIGFSGQVVGSVVVSFQMTAAQKLVAAFAGSEIATDSPDFPDAIGELANMIAGGAKKNVGASANISVPSVIIGAGHTVARLSDVPCVVIPCKTSVGDFAVEVNIKQLGQPAKSN